MHKRSWILVAGLAFVPGAVAAQGATPGFTIGFGVFLNPGAIFTGGSDLSGLFLPVGLGNITIPMRIAGKYRLEPEIGYTSISTSYNDPAGGFGSTSRQSALRYGLNAHVTIFDRAGLRPYAGVRVGAIRARERSSYTINGAPQETKQSRTDVYLGAAIGAEYFFSSGFSLGGEVQLNRIGIGDESIEGTPPPTVTYDSSIWSTTGQVGARFYLF